MAFVFALLAPLSPDFDVTMAKAVSSPKSGENS